MSVRTTSIRVITQLLKHVLAKPDFSIKFRLVSVLLIVLFTIPLVVQSLSLPFGYWDYFTLRSVQGDWLSWRSLAPNLWRNTFQDDWSFRPTNDIFFHLNYLGIPAL